MMKPILAVALAVAVSALFASQASAEPRARDLGIPFDGTPGPLNAITDVKGVTVGHVTLIGDVPGNPRLKIRTGVTAILPRGRDSLNTPVFAASFAQNGNGEMTGTAWVNEGGDLEGPIMLTNSHSVGVVRDAVIQWRVKAGPPDYTGYWWSLPVVAETWDGDLNDANGFHVKPEHVFQALDAAKAGPVAEGNVGGGTGMVCHEFKCGIGTASRVIDVEGHKYTMGVLVQANYGIRQTLRIAGVPVGQHLTTQVIPGMEDAPRVDDTGSIIIVVATDAPLLPHQLRRVTHRATMGLARMGSYSGNGSGDLFIAFSTANAGALNEKVIQRAEFINNENLDPVFLGTVEAVEEAIVNAMVAAHDMEGTEGHSARAIPHDALIQLLKQYNRYSAQH